MAHTILLVVHVLTAILGVGQSAALVVLTARTLAKESLLALGLLVRAATWSLVVMLLTGGALDGVTHGAFHATWWFRISFVLLLLLGFLLGLTRRSLRSLEAAKIKLENARKRVAMLAWIAAVVVAAITVLMVEKPF